MDLHSIYQVAGQLWVLWLVLLFVGIVAWVYLPRNRKRMKDDANIPLRDDDEER
jgi:cbb3-type cytochrome oxidase subunit 3